MPNGIRRKAATVGMLTTHGVPVVLAIGTPTTVTTPDGRPVALVGPLHIPVHPFGNQVHQPNAITGPGSQIVKVDGLPVAFVGDVFQCGAQIVDDGLSNIFME